MSRLPIMLFLLLLAPAAARATSYAAPEPHDVYSPNGKFVLHVNPDTEHHVVYRTADRDTPLWSFDKPVGHEPYLLSNDGKVVVEVAWRHVRQENLASADCLVFRSASGVIRHHSFQDLCPAPARTSMVGIGPIGSFWRTWYTDLEQSNSSFTITTTDWYAYTFDTTTGDIVRRDLVLSNVRYRPLWLAGGFVVGVGLMLALLKVWRARRAKLRTAEIARRMQEAADSSHD